VDDPRQQRQEDVGEQSGTSEGGLLMDAHRYEHLAALATEGLMIHEQGVILDVNLAFATMVGQSEPDSLIGKNALDVIPFTVEGRECVLPHLHSGAVEIHETELSNLDGAVILVEMSCSDINYRGRPARLLRLRDITSRKKIEFEVARQLERLNVLHTVEQAIAGATELSAILELFVQQTTEQIHVDACAILLYNPQTHTLDFAAKRGFITHALEFTHLNIGSGLAGRAAQDRQVVYIPNLDDVTGNPVLLRAIADEHFTAYLGVPLVAKDNLLGVMEIFHRTELPASPDWVKFLEILANEVAIAIDNARLLTDAQQSYKETSALYQINRKLIATIDPQELMDEVVTLLKLNFGYHYVQIFVADPKTGNIVMRAGSGEIGARLKAEGYHLSPGDGIVGFTAETGGPFFTNSVEDLMVFIRPPYLADTRSELAVPIRSGDKFLGLLDIHQIAPMVLTERDVQLVTAVADQLAEALQKAALYADLQEALRHEKATRDQLVHNEKLIIAGRLLASVSHELNNPIQAIQNALFLLKEEQTLSDQGRQDLDIVLSETDRMADMLTRLRHTYRRVNADEFKPVSINDIVQEVGALVATHLRHHQISFELQLDHALPPISGLEDQLRQVALNLVMNAVEAMPGGGHLKISAQYLPETQEALIAVSDTGPGIQEDIFPNIFEAFITNKEHGTGLGLTISQEIILRHGGRIQAENNPQRGATILIWLPVADIKGEVETATR
jgi:PAS domain S-box-containing protein